LCEQIKTCLVLEEVNVLVGVLQQLVGANLVSLCTLLKTHGKSVQCSSSLAIASVTFTVSGMLYTVKNS